MKKLIAVVVFSFAAMACGKKDSKDSKKPAAKPTPTDMAKGNGTDKMAAPTPGAPTPAAPTAPAAGGDIKDAADYEAKGTAVMKQMIDIFATDGKDCAKLAADVNKFMDANLGNFKAFDAFEKAHPDAEAALKTKEEALSKEFEAKAGPSIDACKDNKDLQAALAKMPE
jgi:hypothetical protein